MTTKIKPNLKVSLYKKSNECPINIHTYNSNVTHSMNEFLFFTKELLQVTDSSTLLIELLQFIRHSCQPLQRTVRRCHILDSLDHTGHLVLIQFPIMRISFSALHFHNTCRSSFSDHWRNPKILLHMEPWPYR